MNGIEGQCRRILLLPDDLAIRYKPQLDQGLKTVADAKYEPIAFVKESCDSLLQFLVAEGCCKELCRAIRFISCRKSAREHENLSFVDRCRKLIDRFRYFCRCPAPQNLHIRVGSRSIEGLGRIILTVCSRKDRDKDIRLRKMMRADCNLRHLADRKLFRRLCAFLRPARMRVEDLLQRSGPGRYSLLYRNCDAPVGQLPVIRHNTDHRIGCVKL